MSNNKFSNKKNGYFASIFIVIANILYFGLTHPMEIILILSYSFAYMRVYKHNKSIDLNQFQPEHQNRFPNVSIFIDEIVNHSMQTNRQMIYISGLFFLSSSIFAYTTYLYLVISGLIFLIYFHYGNSANDIKKSIQSQYQEIQTK